MDPDPRNTSLYCIVLPTYLKESVQKWNRWVDKEPKTKGASGDWLKLWWMKSCRRMKTSRKPKSLKPSKKTWKIRLRSLSSRTGASPEGLSYQSWVDHWRAARDLPKRPLGALPKSSAFQTSWFPHRPVFFLFWTWLRGLLRIISIFSRVSKSK